MKRQVGDRSRRVGSRGVGGRGVWVEGKLGVGGRFVGSRSGTVKWCFVVEMCLMEGRIGGCRSVGMVVDVADKKHHWLVSAVYSRLVVLGIAGPRR